MNQGWGWRDWNLVYSLIQIVCWNVPGLEMKCHIYRILADSKCCGTNGPGIRVKWRCTNTICSQIQNIVVQIEQGLGLNVTNAAYSLIQNIVVQMDQGYTNSVYSTDSKYCGAIGPGRGVKCHKFRILTDSLYLPGIRSLVNMQAHSE